MESDNLNSGRIRMVSMTEAEKARLQREAYLSGVDEMYCSHSVPFSAFAANERDRVKRLAIRKFPAPKVTRTRTVTTSRGFGYKLLDEVLYCRDYAEGEWRQSSLRPSDVRLLNALLDHPTEEVDG